MLTEVFEKVGLFREYLQGANIFDKSKGISFSFENLDIELA